MSVTRSPPDATTATWSPTGGRWSATGPPGPSTASIPTAVSPLSGRTAPSGSPAATSPSTSSWLTPRPPRPPRAAPSTTPSSCIDRPTDVRNLYVAMTRGSHTNHAYLAIQGEQTAHDVFVRCLVSDWIDQPAHTRRAELAGEPPHRAGLLDGTLLRSLLERRHELASELELAEARQQRLPGEIRHTQTAKAAAERTIADLEQRQRQAEAAARRVRPAPPPAPPPRRHHQRPPPPRRPPPPAPPGTAGAHRRQRHSRRPRRHGYRVTGGPGPAHRHRNRDRRPRRPDRPRSPHPHPRHTTRTTRSRRSLSSAPGPQSATMPGAGTSPPVASPNTKPPSTWTTVSGRDPTTWTAPPTATATKPSRSFSSRFYLRPWTEQSPCPISASPSGDSANQRRALHGSRPVLARPVL